MKYLTLDQSIEKVVHQVAVRFTWKLTIRKKPPPSITSTFINSRTLDVILLESIYLLKRQLQSIYGLSFWIECSFKAALERAIARSQEGLTPIETGAAYQTIYFPAQRIHFERDQSPKSATAIIHNNK